MLQREIVLDRDLNVIGYDFRLRESVLKRKVHVTHNVSKLYDEVLLRNFLADEATKPFGQKRIFLNISVWALDSPLFKLLSKAQFVLMLRYDEEFFTNPLEHFEKLQALKQVGFQIGFDQFPIKPELISLFPLADYLKLSIAGKDVQELSGAISALGQAAPESEVVVGDIHFFEELQVCRQLQIHYLQGSYLRYREYQEDAAIDANYLRLLEVLNLVRAEAETPIIANAMKYDPMLTFKLLRYVNSPGGGLMTKVDSLERALVVLGHQKLYRWLSLLMFSHDQQHESSHSALLETALIRGRIMETLGRKTFKGGDIDQLFTTGMFSMLDALLKKPLPSILEKLSLPAAINQALIDHGGPFGNLLKLALQSEDGDLPEDPALYAACGVSQLEVNRAQIEALLWVEEVV